MSSKTSPKRTILPRSFGKIVGGRLDLSGRGLKTLKDLGVQPTLEILILSNNDLKTFESLMPQPNLTTIIADNNPIEFLNGLREQPKLTALDISNSPLSKRNKFVYYTLATVGPKLLYINGKKLTRDDQTAADILAKRKPELLYLGSVEDDEDDEIIAQEEQDKQIHQVYTTEHQQFFFDFAYNDAVLFDLEKNGPLPYIDKYSTEEEISAAIHNVRKRNEKLREKVDELSGV